MNYLDKVNSLKAFLQQNSGKKLKKKRAFASGGTTCPEGESWSQEFGMCVSAKKLAALNTIKTEAANIKNLAAAGDLSYKKAADEFKSKYNTSWTCPDYGKCEIPETSTTTTTTTSPKFSIKSIKADQYVIDPKTYDLGTDSPQAKDYRYRIETDKGFDILPSKKAFDEWKTKYTTEYQPYYKIKSAPVDYNTEPSGLVYNETPTLKYEEAPQLVKKYGGKITKKKSKLKQVYLNKYK